MKVHGPSKTAGTIAAHRALESRKPEDKRVCYDPFAERLLDPHFSAFGEFRLPKKPAYWLYEAIFPGFNGYFVARTRHIDEYLQACIQNGLEQLVILGAGYDSRAYRFEQLKGQAKIFEVDQPATQRVKTAKLKAIFGRTPEHVTFVPIDFTQETLGEKLYEKGYERQLNTLFIWEGVTMYITQEAVDAVLAFVVKNSGEGSSIIFDYTHLSVVKGTSSRWEAKTWRRGAKRLNERLLFGIEEENIEGFLTQRGFDQINNANHIWLKQRYFIGANRERQITPIMDIVHAAVKPSASE